MQSSALCFYCAIVVLQWHLTWSFLLPSSSSSVARMTQHGQKHNDRVLTLLHGQVLSKSAILKGVGNKRKTSSSSFRHYQGISKSPPPTPAQKIVSKSFLLEAIDEALFRQELILQALEEQQQELATKQNKTELAPNEDDNMHQSQRKKFSSIALREKQIQNIVTKLQDLKTNLMSEGRLSNGEGIIESYTKDFIDLGFQGVLNQPPDSWKIRRKDREEYGRPQGFSGLVFYSPLGVPILVSKPKAHKDETLRRISQGSDLWFQVEDYSGSRVLLRTSLRRGLKGSKKCMQMAADLAARYSDHWNYHYDDNNHQQQQIPVMYTDSKHVAKRGGKVGQMRQRKSLGRMYGNPNNVEEITRGNLLNYDTVHLTRNSFGS